MHNIYRFFRNWMMFINKMYYFGSFDSFEKASIESKKYGNSYQDETILENVADATKKVIDGKAVYEQDGICYC